MGSDPDKTVVACLDVDDILAIQPPEPFHGLTVEGEKALLEDGSVNTHPGAYGHAGIAGLCQGGRGTGDKNRRKLLRSRLADQATISPVPVPHDIPAEHIRVAADFIHVNRGKENGSPEDDWIRAIRQLRRARVRQGGQPNPRS
jgi:hypothetical protein